MRNPAYRDIEDKLLGATFDYLVKNGLEKVSLRELCKSTGISMGSIYYWFDGKDELIIDSADYGLEKTAESIFDNAFEETDNAEQFFNTCISKISENMLRLRFIYQLATSPGYGERMRKKLSELDFTYIKYAEKLSAVLGCSEEQVLPLVYLFVSAILDYVVRENKDKAKTQLDYIFDRLDDCRTQNAV